MTIFFKTSWFSTRKFSNENDKKLRESLSTETALYSAVTKINKHLKAREYVIGDLMDFGSTFNYTLKDVIPDSEFIRC